MSENLAKEGRSVGRDLNNGFPVNSERCHIIEQMADRIEELEAEIADLKAKLAKAVKRMEDIINAGLGYDSALYVETVSLAARATLAELKGNPND